MSDNHGTAWIVTDAVLWRKFTDIRQLEIKTWLRMNGINPLSVPADSTVMLAERPPGDWKILYEEYCLSADGMLMVDPDDPNSAYVRECSVTLAIDPPQHWLIPAINTAA